MVGGIGMRRDISQIKAWIYEENQGGSAGNMQFYQGKTSTPGFFFRRENIFVR